MARSKNTVRDIHVCETSWIEVLYGACACMCFEEGILRGSINIFDGVVWWIKSTNEDFFLRFWMDIIESSG